jgi:membrane protease YdiL (CAAX protease family)
VSDQPPVSASPPDPPELPEGAPAPPRSPGWPAWYAPAAFVVVVGATTVLAGTVLAIAGKSADDHSAVVTIIGTVIQAAVFIGTAVMFASFVGKPEPWQFGLRRTRFWPAVGWAALGLFAFYAFAAIYAAVAQPDVEQTVTKELGADQGTAGLIAAGLVVIVVAPISEEFFFRGFFFRALRNRFPVLIAAAIDGLVFGFIHWDFSTAHGLLIVPPLAFLGFVFCLIYERTGSLFPVIALHAINNSAAYAAQVHDGWSVSVVVGPLMIAALILAPRALPRAAPAPG